MALKYTPKEFANSICWFSETMVAQMWRKMYGSPKLSRSGFVQWGKVGKAASVSLALPNAEHSGTFL